jgi:hypothetical protein
VRYHFHIRDREGLIADEEGSELPDLDAAHQEACASARDFAIEDLKRGATVEERKIEITAADGTLLQSVGVQEIVVH